jgi:hypothetical protein
MRTNDKTSRQRPKSALDARPAEPIDVSSGGSNSCNAPSPPIGSDARVPTKGADAKLSLPERLATLPNLSLGDLRLEWRRLFRAEPPRLSRDIMMRAIAYRLQEIAHGGLSRITQRRLMTLANALATDGRIAPPPGPRIKPGARLIREWHGRTHTVCVTETGFEFEGKTYRSLTKIASDITGAQWSGPRFFGLTKTPAAAAPGDASDCAGNIAENTNG